MKKENNQTVERFNPTAKDGLSSEQVNQRIKEGKTNKTKVVLGKSLAEIIFTNVFSFFNICYFIIAGFIIYSGQYRSLFFLAIIIPNMIIGLVEDLNARRLMKKMKIMTAPRTTVIRDGRELDIPSSEVVLDEIVVLKNSSQISADGEVVDGYISVNESLLTGESNNISKDIGDRVFSGSYVTSGTARVHVTEVGSDTYVEGIQKKASKFKRPQSQIMSSLKIMFRVIMVVVIILGAGMIITNVVQGKLKFDNQESFKAAIASISGSFISMIPAGLYLLTSVALTAGFLKLMKKRTYVQEVYSIEMLARTDVLCVDKTGTITDATMKVKTVVPYGTYTSDNIAQILSNLLAATQDESPTTKALLEFAKYEPTAKSTMVLPFSSANKYSGASFGTKGTYILGAAEFLNVNNKNSVVSKCEEYTNKGYRVLVLAHSSEQIKGETFSGLLEPIALVVIEDNIRPEAYETFKWFKDNNVEIKVISGDNARTVSEVAKSVGIANADQYVSLENRTDEEVASLALKCSVFGRVTPAQKAIIVEALKKEKKTVAMTGDGVNDILALKKADCSIAMANGSQAARNVSHIVLLDSDFSRLPSVVHEGRRVINNLQRTASLFLVKTIFAVVLTLVFLIASWFDKEVSYPFVVNNLYPWELCCIGIASFFLALQGNSEKVNGHKFLWNVFKVAIPAAICQIAIVIFFFSMYLARVNDGPYFGLSLNSYSGPLAGPTIGFIQTVAMSVISFSIFSLAALFTVASPLDKYRRFVFIGCSALMSAIFVFEVLMSYFAVGDKNILFIGFKYLSPYNWMWIGIVTALVIAVYLFATYLVKVLKGSNRDGNKN